MAVTNHDSLKPSSHFQWINYAKGIAIILIVYRHTLTGMTAAGININTYFITANEIFLSFRMPLFFIISGFFFAKSLNKRGPVLFIKSRAFTILYPYFLWGGLQISIQIVLSSYTNTYKSVSDYLNLLVSPRSVDQFWYLYTLFAVTLIYLLINYLVKGNKPVQLFIGLLLYTFLPYFEDYEVVWLLANFYVYFAIGDYVSNFIFNNKTFDILSSKKLLICIMPLFMIAQLIWIIDTNLPLPAKFLIALIGCFFVLIISFRIDKLKIINWLVTIGKYSLPIYLTHILIISGIRIVLNKLFGFTNGYIMLPLSIISGIYLPILFYRIMVIKLGFYWLFSFENNSNKEAA